MVETEKQTATDRTPLLLKEAINAQDFLRNETAD